MTNKILNYIKETKIRKANIDPSHTFQTDIINHFKEYSRDEILKALDSLVSSGLVEKGDTMNDFYYRC